MLIREFISETNKTKMISDLLKYYKVGSVKVKQKSMKNHAHYDVDRGTLELSTKYKTIKSQLLYDHAHNDYLELISNMGFAGFIIIIAGGACYLIVLTRIFLRRRDPFVRGITIGCLGGISYIILHSLTDFNLQIPANALHLSMITGIMHKTITQL